MMSSQSVSKKASPSKASKRSFHQELVLNRWVLSFFEGNSLNALKLRLGDERYQGIDEYGQSRFFDELKRDLFAVNSIPVDDLCRYDLNIVTHWQSITVQRNKLECHELQMKYFQYLSLLFTEIYLDWYFNKREDLLDALNTEMECYRKEDNTEAFRDFSADDLNKIAFWSATGSGKTLLLHVNIKQYLHYFQAGRSHHYPSKIILLTPNEGLSRQHLEELHLSGFSLAQFFNKEQFPPQGTVEIIDINKLGDEMGDKTVAVSAFQGNNLVLVDEGHRGTGTAAGAWMNRRDALVRGGFAFEYSATFGQAVAKGLTVAQAEEEIKKKRAKKLFNTINLKKLDDVQLQQLTLTHKDQQEARTIALREIYAKCILFDYSYKFFYEDGYGKESVILNVSGDTYQQTDNAAKYFTACLLAFYQQLRLWDTYRDKLLDFNIEKPLWVFVGNTVSGEESDILEVVKFLAYFLNNKAQIKQWLTDLIAERAQILDAKGNNVFKGRFIPLMDFADNTEALYADILQQVFNARSNQRLKLVNIKNSKGELALRVGDEPFGLISIGDDAGFFAMTEDQNTFDRERDDFGGALFGTLNNQDNHLNVLIGSRKFTEGWSSWRVSTMGLLNMGQGEGSQIIQLFGRGVRLKGKDLSLKRTTPQERPRGIHLDKLETLNIFGVRASYMAIFKDYLREEGVTPSDEILELDFPTSSNLPATKLKTLTLKDGYKENQKFGFKHSLSAWLGEIPQQFQGKIKPPHAVLDLYPRAEALSTNTKGRTVPVAEVRHRGILDRNQFPMFYWDRIYIALEKYKLKRGYTNIRLDREKLINFCTQTSDWYTLFVPAAELSINSFSDVIKQERILIDLLITYTNDFYNKLKAAYEGQFYDITYIDEEHGSMLKLYHFQIENNDDGQKYQERLEVLRQLVSERKIGEASRWYAPQMVAISFDRHLYYPLFGIENKNAVPLKIRPLALDAPSERQFVEDLEKFYKSTEGKTAIGARSLYLLRNADRKEKGLGFALAGGFYPDFLLWLVDDATGKQWLSFVDPKGLRNINLSDPKLRLYQEVKILETILANQAKPGETPLILNAFILSFTEFSDLLNVDTLNGKDELEKRHVLFMKEGGRTYLKKLFDVLV